MAFVVVAEGVDYSQGWPGSAALRNNNKTFIARYLAKDSRGLTIAEVQDARNGNVGIVCIYESTEQRAIDGFAAGAWDAAYAQAILVSLGLPPNMPIYFTGDWDFAPEDQPAINSYLDGCASVIGLKRVGFYAGYHVLKRVMAAGKATWFWQTSAWSSNPNNPSEIWLNDGIHLYQYSYDTVINGVACDNVRAFQDNYGQHTKFLVDPNPAPTPAPMPDTFPIPQLPDWWGDQLKLKYPTDQTYNGALWIASRRKSIVLNETPQLMSMSPKARPAGPTLEPGDVVHVERLCKISDAEQWAILHAGGKGKEGARVRHSDLKDTPEVP